MGENDTFREYLKWLVISLLVTVACGVGMVVLSILAWLGLFG